MQAVPVYRFLERTMSPSDELALLTQTTGSMDELLEEVNDIIEQRFFSKQIDLSNDAMDQWLWWEQVRKNFSEIMESLEVIH